MQSIIINGVCLSVCDKVADEIIELRLTLMQAREALVANIVGTSGRTPKTHDSIARINKALGDAK